MNLNLNLNLNFEFGESVCDAKVTFQARVWRELYDQTQKMAASYRKQKLHLFSWRVFLLLLLASNIDPLCFSAHSGSNLLPEPGVILDVGSLVAMVVKEVVVISGLLFGGVMSVTAGGTQKRYDNSIKLEWNTINLEEWSVRNKEIK